MEVLKLSAGDDSATFEGTLVFRLGHTWFGINALHVAEIASNLSITTVPRAPSHLLGVTNLRGRAVPVLDLAGYLGLKMGDQEAAFHYVVTHIHDMHVALPCNRVSGIEEISPDDITKGTAGSAAKLSRFLLGEYDTKDRLLLLIDLPELLEDARVRQ